MVVIFTPVHGAYETFLRTRAAIDLYVPRPCIHIVGDDFSPEPDASSYALLDGYDSSDGYHIKTFHCRDIGGTISPNLGLAMKHVFAIVRALKPEALMLVESDVVLTPGIVDRFREAVDIWGAERTGAVAPLYTKVGENRVETFGGLDDFPSFGIPRFTEVGSWDNPEVARLGVIPWCHTACMWIPNSTLQRPDQIDPDPAFPLYYVDHDLTHQIINAGLDIIVTSRAVAGHTRGGGGTIVRWPNTQERETVERVAFHQLEAKWAGH